MNKQDLGVKIAEKFDLPKSEGEEIVKFMLNVIMEKLKEFLVDYDEKKWYNELHNIFVG